MSTKQFVFTELRPSKHRKPSSNGSQFAREKTKRSDIESLRCRVHFSRTRVHLFPVRRKLELTLFRLFDVAVHFFFIASTSSTRTLLINYKMTASPPVVCLSPKDGARGSSNIVCGGVMGGTGASVVIRQLMDSKLRESVGAMSSAKFRGDFNPSWCYPPIGGHYNFDAKKNQEQKFRDEGALALALATEGVHVPVLCWSARSGTVLMPRLTPLRDALFERCDMVRLAASMLLKLKKIAKLGLCLLDLKVDNCLVKTETNEIFLIDVDPEHCLWMEFELDGAEPVPFVKDISMIDSLPEFFYVTMISFMTGSLEMLLNREIETSSVAAENARRLLSYLKPALLRSDLVRHLQILGDMRIRRVVNFYWKHYVEKRGGSELLSWWSKMLRTSQADGRVKRKPLSTGGVGRRFLRYRTSSSRVAQTSYFNDNLEKFARELSLPEGSLSSGRRWRCFRPPQGVDEENRCRQVRREATREKRRGSASAMTDVDRRQSQRGEKPRTQAAFRSTYFRRAPVESHGASPREAAFVSPQSTPYLSISQ
jgi:hypothetical protein